MADHIFRNLSFEEIASTDYSGNGMAEYWTFTVLENFWNWADFDTDPSVVGFETFIDTEWLASAFMYEFEGLGTDLSAGVFGSAGTSTTENFDSQWATGYVTTMGAVTEAWFDNDETLTVESFGLASVWCPTYDSELTDPPDLILAEFGGGPDDSEDFEVDFEWLDGGASYLTAFVGLGTDLTAAEFNPGADSEESFESDW